MSIESAEKLKQENYEKIIAASRELLSHNTIHKTSFLEISKKAGVARRTVINIFGTKNNLLILTVIRYFEGVIMDMDEAIASEKFKNLSGLDQIMELLILRAKILKDNSFAARLIRELEEVSLNSQDELDSFKKYVSATEMIRQKFRVLLKKGIQDGSIKPGLNVDETEDFLFFSFGAVAQRLSLINANESIRNQLDLVNIMRMNLHTIKSYLKNY